jgi:hypothetical protein
MKLFRNVFKIRIVYKSGYVHDFDALEFSINRGTYKWNTPGVNNIPIELGVEEIAAIWQLGAKRQFHISW